MSDDRREGQSKFDRTASTYPFLPSAPPPIYPPAGPGATAQPAIAPAPPGPAPTVAAAQPVPRAAPAPTAQSVTLPVGPPPFPVTSTDDDDDSDLEEDEMAPTMMQRVRRLQPAPVVLTVASLGSLVFLIKSLTSHTTPLGVLLSAAVVTGLVFGADAVVASRATWRASQGGETGTAFLLAFIGGISSLISLGALAGTLVMVLVINS